MNHQLPMCFVLPDVRIKSLSLQCVTSLSETSLYHSTLTELNICFSVFFYMYTDRNLLHILEIHITVFYF